MSMGNPVVSEQEKLNAEFYEFFNARFSHWGEDDKKIIEGWLREAWDQSSWRERQRNKEARENGIRFLKLIDDQIAGKVTLTPPKGGTISGEGYERTNENDRGENREASKG